jgi:hypothetical protein
VIRLSEASACEDMEREFSNIFASLSNIRAAFPEVRHFIGLADTLCPDKTHVRFSKWKTRSFAMSLPVFPLDLAIWLAGYPQVKDKDTRRREIGTEDIKHRYSYRRPLHLTIVEI